MIDPFGIRALKEDKEKLDKKHVGADESPYSLAGRAGSDNETGDHEVNPVISDVCAIHLIEPPFTYFV